MKFILKCLERIAEMGAGCASFGLAYQPEKPKDLCILEDASENRKSLTKTGA